MRFCPIRTPQFVCLYVHWFVHNFFKCPSHFHVIIKITLGVYSPHIFLKFSMYFFPPLRYSSTLHCMFSPLEYSSNLPCIFPPPQIYIVCLASPEVFLIFSFPVFHTFHQPSGGSTHFSNSLSSYGTRMKRGDWQECPFL